MSGGQDEASEYIKTGGTNVFKKTERTKCGNCVYWEQRQWQDGMGNECHRGRCHAGLPTSDSESVGAAYWCRHFEDREPEAKPAELQPAVCGQCGTSIGRRPDGSNIPGCDHLQANSDGSLTAKPAGELREWWLELKHDDDSCWAWCNEKFALSSADEDDEIIHVREVPSRERVREAIETMAKTMGMAPASMMNELLRTLGISTDGL